MEALTHIARTYGGYARAHPWQHHVLSDPEMLKEMLITHRQKYMKNIRYRHNRRWARLLLRRPSCGGASASSRSRRSLSDRQFGRLDGTTCDHLAPPDGHADRGDASTSNRTTLAQLLSGRYLLGEPFADIADEFCEVAAACKKPWPQAPRNIVSAFVPHSKALIARFDAAIAALDACIFGFIQRNRATDFEGCGVL